MRTRVGQRGSEKGGEGGSKQRGGESEEFDGAWRSRFETSPCSRRASVGEWHLGHASAPPTLEKCKGERERRRRNGPLLARRPRALEFRHANPPPPREKPISGPRPRNRAPAETDARQVREAEGPRGPIGRRLGDGACPLMQGLGFFSVPSCAYLRARAAESQSRCG
jgi:hypothetical protein